MKICKKISSGLKICAFVLLFVSVILAIYMMATDGAAWSSFSGKLKENGVSVSLLSRFRFDPEYFGALSDAFENRSQSGNRRTEAAKTHFAHYQSAVDSKAELLSASALEAEIAAFENEFDYELFSKNYLATENREEQRNLRQMLDELDEMFRPAGKGGKKLAIKAVSCEDTLKESYAALCERLPECGSYFEYVSVLYTDIKQRKQNGEAIASISDAAASLSDEAYLNLLANLKSSSITSVQNISDTFYEQIASPKLDGKQADIRAYLNAQYDVLNAGGNGISMDLFAGVMRRQMADPAFDGSSSQLSEALNTANADKQNHSFAAFLRSFCTEIVAQCDKSASVPFFGVLWKIASVNGWLWLSVAILLLLSLFTRKLAEKTVIDSVRSAAEEYPQDELLRVEHLKQYFRKGDFLNKAVNDVSFSISRGEVLGLVGESGCGKTTTGRTIINLYDPTDGDVYYDGLRISSTQNGLSTLLHSMKTDYQEEQEKLQEKLDAELTLHPEQKEALRRAHQQKLSEMRARLREQMEQARDHALISSVEKDRCVQRYREKRAAELTTAYEKDCKALTGEALAARKKRYKIDMRLCRKDNIMTRMQMIFQDPIASINPRMTVREIIAEGLRIRGVKDKDYINEKVNEMLELVGLVREHADRYPHEFSGGQRQRIGIARAIIMNPELIIADEPISALDVSIQAQVINLLNELRSTMGLTILFIAHNLSVVKYFSDRIAVMYYGKIVELAPSDELFAHPLHPYTKSLLSAIPYPDPQYEKNRKRMEYNPAKAHDYSTDLPSLREIIPGHYIHCNNAEYESYRKELEQ